MTTTTSITTAQKKFLLSVFFENEKYPGWFGIADTLIDKGECIVAGTECIWKGGIGNFIKCEPYADAFGCSIYKFNIDDFMTSKWFKEQKELYLAELTQEMEVVYNKYKNLLDGFNEVTEM